MPVIGARTVQRLTETIAAQTILLSDQDVARIEKAVPADAVAGDRYAEAQMAQLDSERASAINRASASNSAVRS